MKKEIVRANNLSKWYKQRSEKLFTRNKSVVKAVDDVNFTLYEGEVLGIIGESGCGKSTLGRILVRLEEPTNGEVFIEGKESKKMLEENLKKFRRTIQIVFQNPFDTFTPKHTIWKIMNRALTVHNIGKSDEERYKMCFEILEDSGLIPAEKFLSRYPHELSGGQLQRISILRSMMLKPLFLVADEPVSMLDVSVRAEILNMLKSLVKNNKTGMIFISHDIAVTRYISDRINVMYLGRIVESGTSDDIIKNPKHPYTQALISNCASIDFDDEEPIKIDGEPPTPVNPGPGCYFADRCFKASEKCLKEYPGIKKFENGHTASCHYI